MKQARNLYAVLSVSPDADPVVIEAAYRALIKRHHPDKLGAVAGGTGRAAEINEAFAILRDPAKRARYDREELGLSEGTVSHRQYAGMWSSSPAAGQPAGGPGWRAPPPVPRSRGKKLPALLFLAGAAALVGTVVVFAHEFKAGSGITVTADAGGTAAEPLLTVEALPNAEDVRLRPVSPAQVHKAVAHMRRIVARSGMVGAADYSESCFETHSQTLGISEFDYCVAFDQAASNLAALIPEGSEPAALPARFNPHNLSARHISAAERLSSDSTWVVDRLDIIRELTGFAMSDVPQRFVAPDPLEPQLMEESAILQPDPATVAVAPVQQAGPARHRPRRRMSEERPRRIADPPRPALAQPPDHEFLEREDGIY